MSAPAVNEERPLLPTLVEEGLASTIEVSADEVAAGGGRRRFRRGLAAGGLVAAAALAGVGALAWRRPRRCALEPLRLTNEEHADDVMRLYEAQTNDTGFVDRWLKAAGDVNSAATKADRIGDKAAFYTVADAALKAALASKSERQSQAAIQRAVDQAVAKTRVQHSTIASIAGVSKLGKSAKVAGKVLKTMHKATHISPTQQAQRAYCVVRSGYALSLIFQAASDIHDAALTCPKSRHIKDGNFYNNTRGQVCAINVGEGVMDLVALSATLSLTANDCAASLIPDIDTYCAASVTGFLTAFAQFGGLGVLFMATCGPNHPRPMPGMTPSNLGSMVQDPYNTDSVYPYLDFHSWSKEYHNRPGGFNHKDGHTGPMRHIDLGAAAEGAEEGSAPARKLLYGGGKASTGVQCFVDISDAVWFLAQAGLAISSASGHTGLLGGCPPKNIFGGTKDTGGSFYHWASIYCAVDAIGVVSYLLAVASFIQFAVVNCGDVLNFDTICGSAITGLGSAALASAQSAMGLHLTCDPNQLQNPTLKKLASLGRDIDIKSGSKISNLMGRRLRDEIYEHPVWGIDTLKKTFGSPEEVWKHIGFDLNNPPKDLRQQLKDLRASPADSDEEFRRVVMGEGKPDTVGLSEAQDTCL